MFKDIHQVSSFQTLRALPQIPSNVRSDGQRADLFRLPGLCLDKACTSQILRVLPQIPSLIRGDGQHVETIAIERKIVCSFFVHLSCFSCVQCLETSYLHGTGECWHMSRACFFTLAAFSRRCFSTISPAFWRRGFSTLRSASSRRCFSTLSTLGLMRLENL